MDDFIPSLYEGITSLPDITPDMIEMDFMDELVDNIRAHTGLKKTVCKDIVQKFLFLIRSYLIKGFTVDCFIFRITFKSLMYKSPTFTVSDKAFVAFYKKQNNII
jgi:hypothetical protein